MDEIKEESVQATSIKLDKEMLERIDKLALKYERSRSQQIRWIIKKYLETVDE